MVMTDKYNEIIKVSGTNDELNEIHKLHMGALKYLANS
jgi:hypothetical protein